MELFICYFLLYEPFVLYFQISFLILGTSDIPDIIQAFFDADYIGVIESLFAQDVLGENLNIVTPSNIENAIKDNIKAIITNEPER